MISSSNKQSKQPLSQIVQIYVRNSKKQAFKVKTLNHQTYDTIMELIFSKTKIEPQNQIVYYNGKQVERGSQIKLIKNSIVHVIDKRNVKKSKINILVKQSHSNGLQHKFQIDSDTSIQKFIKEKLCKSEQDPAEDLFFVYTGRQLKKNKSFSDQFVEEGSQIICMKQSKSTIRKTNGHQEIKKISNNIKYKADKQGTTNHFQYKNSNQMQNKTYLTSFQHQQSKQQNKQQELLNHEVQDKQLLSHEVQDKQQKLLSHEVQNNDQKGLNCKLKKNKIIKSINEIEGKQYESDEDEKPSELHKIKQNHFSILNTNSKISQLNSGITQPNFKKKNKQVQQVFIASQTHKQPENVQRFAQSKKQSIFQFNNYSVSSIVIENHDIQNKQIENKNLHQIYNSQINFEGSKQIYVGKGFMNLSNNDFLQNSSQNQFQQENINNSIETTIKNNQILVEGENYLIQKQKKNEEKSDQISFSYNKAPELISSFQQVNESKEKNISKEEKDIKYIEKINNMDSLQFSNNFSRSHKQPEEYNEQCDNSEVKKLQFQESNLLQQSELNKNQKQFFNKNKDVHQSQIHSQLQSINFSFQPCSIQNNQEHHLNNQTLSKIHQHFNKKQHRIEPQITQSQNFNFNVDQINQVLFERQEGHSIIQNLVQNCQIDEKNSSQCSYNVRVTQVESLSSTEENNNQEFIQIQYHPKEEQANLTLDKQSCNNNQLKSSQSSSQIFLSYQAYKGNTQSIVSNQKRGANSFQREVNVLQEGVNPLQSFQKGVYNMIQQKFSQNQKSSFKQNNEASIRQSAKFIQIEQSCQNDQNLNNKINQATNKIKYEAKPCLLPGDYVYLGQSNIPQQQVILKDIISNYMHCL